jgi:SAM-dependent methyltransferase
MGLRLALPLPTLPSSARLKRRFHAWWEGYEFVDEPTTTADASAALVAPTPLPEVWTPERIRIAEMIWGDGFNFPGGEILALDLVTPLGLDGEKQLLDVGCGLGGGARAMAARLGVWVDGLESSGVLAGEGAKLTEKSASAKKVTITPFDPMTGTLPTKRYDVVFVRNTLSMVEDKPTLISALLNVVKPEGQIVFVELALAKHDDNSPALEAWRAIEDQLKHPATAELIAGALIRERVDVRVVEDLSGEFRKHVLQGWARFADVLKTTGIADSEKPIVAHELELWARRIAACTAGDLKFVRVHAIKRPG